MARPWSVALGLGGESLSPNGGQAIGLGVLELAGHYRFRPALELGLTLDGGGGRSGTISTGGLYVDFRYHVHPEQPWNVIFQGSLGVGTACGKDASDLECKGRPSARVGVGLERRLGMWALEGDLRVLTVRDNKEVPDPVSETTPYLVARYALVGVVLSFGASLYF
jgi:hypothetical protein